VRTLLIADADGAQGEKIVDALGDDNVKITAVASGQEAIEALQRHEFDCMVVGPALRDMRGIALLRRFAETRQAAGVPIVMCGAEGSFSPSEQDNLRKLAEIVILKNVGTLEAVLRETTLFLHQAVDKLPSKKRRLLADLQKATPELGGRKVLIIDDDIRNIFALTGALEMHGTTAIHAENGKDGIEMLKSNPDVDLVLMDIMMPELDGYDTIRVIRGLEDYKHLPIIAITAKAMKGDREKCIEAGASDYIAKPVNMEQLLSLLRVWLAR
jgi:CheY-like chemotaxis protein